jgi:hypothetical protein
VTDYIHLAAGLKEDLAGGVDRHSSVLIEVRCIRILTGVVVVACSHWNHCGAGGDCTAHGDAFVENPQSIGVDVALRVDRQTAQSAARFSHRDYRRGGRNDSVHGHDFLDRVRVVLRQVEIAGDVHGKRLRAIRARERGDRDDV